MMRNNVHINMIISSDSHYKSSCTYVQNLRFLKWLSLGTFSDFASKFVFFRVFNSLHTPHGSSGKMLVHTANPQNMDARSTKSTANPLNLDAPIFFYPKVAMFGLLLRIQCKVGISHKQSLAVEYITNDSFLKTPLRQI